MKRIIVATLLVFFFCAGVFAQADLQVLAVVKLKGSEPITLGTLKSRVAMYEKQRGGAKLSVAEKKEVLDAGLEKTKRSVFEKISHAIAGKSTIDDEVLDNLEEVFKAEKTNDFLKGFYRYIVEDLNLQQKTLDFIARQEEQELFDLADETARVWESVSIILNQIYEIMGEEAFDAEEFRDMFLVGLGQVEVGLLPPTEDGLILGNIQRSRSGRVKAMVVIGANEGILPQEKPTQGLFSAEEREAFKICLEKIRKHELDMKLIKKIVTSIVVLADGNINVNLINGRTIGNLEVESNG